MKLEVIVEERDNQWYCKAIGEVNIETYLKFKVEILQNYNLKPMDILIDASDLEYIDSTGLGALFAIYKHIEKHSIEEKYEAKKIIIENLRKHILKLFKITEMDKVFEVRGASNE